MGKLMKGGISYGGVADIDITKEDVVLIMGEMPSNPRDGMTILYEGDTTQDFTNGHVYQYSEEDAEWMFFPLSPDNTIPCPRLNHFNLLEYDDKCIAFGGASADGKQKALDGIYVSQDYGITWRPSTEIHMPIELEGIEGCIASTVDTNNYIWIITNAQVWRGRLNRLGFAQQ